MAAILPLEARIDLAAALNAVEAADLDPALVYAIPVGGAVMAAGGPVFPARSEGTWGDRMHVRVAAGDRSPVAVTSRARPGRRGPRDRRGDALPAVTRPDPIRIRAFRTQEPGEETVSDPIAGIPSEQIDNDAILFRIPGGTVEPGLTRRSVLIVLHL